MDVLRDRELAQRVRRVEISLEIEHEDVHPGRPAFRSTSPAAQCLVAAFRRWAFLTAGIPRPSALGVFVPFSSPGIGGSSSLTTSRPLSDECPDWKRRPQRVPWILTLQMIGGSSMPSTSFQAWASRFDWAIFRALLMSLISPSRATNTEMSAEAAGWVRSIQPLAKVGFFSISLRAPSRP